MVKDSTGAALAVALWLVCASEASAGTIWPVNPGQRIGPFLEHARAGDTVHVEGVHDENLRVPAGVTLEGGPGAAIESSRVPVVRVIGPGVEVSGLLLATSAGASARVGLLDVPRGDATVIGCTLQGGAIGLSVEGSASATVAACQMIGQSLAGALIGGHSTVEIANTRFQPSVTQRENQDGPAYGIEATGASVATIVGDRVVGTTLAAIAFSEGASGSAKGAYLKDGMDGIDVSGHSSPTLSGNTALGNLGDGIAYADQAAGIAQGNTCERDRWGIVIPASAHPTLEGNACKGNRDGSIEQVVAPAPGASPAPGS